MRTPLRPYLSLLMVLPDNEENSYQRLKKIVMEVNNEKLSLEEKLNDEVYYYDVKEKIFKKGISYEER